MSTVVPEACCLTPLLENALREQQRCERLQDGWQGIDNMLTGNCAFDAGALYACQRILETWRRGEGVLAAIESLISEVAELNAERTEDEP